MAKSYTAVMVMDDVLRKTLTDAPIDTGKLLYHALSSQYGIVILSNETKDQREWLSDQGIRIDNYYYAPELGVDRVTQIKSLHFEYGYSIDLVVEPDPHHVARLLQYGIPTLGFFHPYYSHPSWRPDGSGSNAESWEEIKQEIMQGKAYRADDDRLSFEDAE